MTPKVRAAGGSSRRTADSADVAGGERSLNRGHGPGPGNLSTAEARLQSCATESRAFVKLPRSSHDDFHDQLDGGGAYGRDLAALRTS